MGVVVIAVVAVAALTLFSSPSTLPASANVTIDPVKRSCKNTTAFTCTMVLNATPGSAGVSDVKSVILRQGDLDGPEGIRTLDLSIISRVL